MTESEKGKILDKLVEIYSFRYEDAAVDYEPNEFERVMLQDFGEQLIEELENQQ